MNLSLPDSIKFDDLISMLPEDFVKWAKDCLAFQRDRKVHSPIELIHLVFLYCIDGHSLRDVAGVFTLLGESISDTAIHNRLRACGPWLKLILQKMWFSKTPKVAGNFRLILIDGSSLSVPGANGTSYRLHLAIDLVKLEIIHVELTDKRIGESLLHFPLLEGDVLVADRGYHSPVEVINVSEKGTLVTMRISPNNIGLYDDAHKPQKIKMFDILSAATSDDLCLPVRVRVKNSYVKAYIHARRLPERLRAEARRQCKQRSKSETVKQETLLYAEWTMVLTTVPPEVLDTATVMALYKLRWQIELFIKRLKSLIDIGALRCIDEKSALNNVFIYGKLLFATLVGMQSDKKFGVSGLEPDDKRDATPWRFWKMIMDEIYSIVMVQDSRKSQNYLDAKRVMTERPRKRQLQSLPEKVKELVRRFG